MHAILLGICVFQTIQKYVRRFAKKNIPKSIDSSTDGSLSNMANETQAEPECRVLKDKVPEIKKEVVTVTALTSATTIY